MTANLKSSVYMDLLREIHADIADDLGIDLTIETKRALSVLNSNGLPYFIDWNEKLLHSVVVDLKDSGQVQYRELISFVFHSNSVSVAARAYAHLRQLYSLFRKLEDTTCFESAESALLSFFDRNASHDQPLTTDQLVLARRLGEIMPMFLSDLDDNDLTQLIPDIGPGASFEKRPRTRRPAFYDDVRLSFRGAEHEPAPRVSRACAVPKTYKRMRLIFVEPSSRMLVQKAVQGYMYEAARRYPLRNYVSFTDQGFQRRKLHFDGAATIDLSDASDHIDRRLVWIAFQRLPRLRSILFKARSVYEQTKHMFYCFSTMGNATTFPVMTLLLTCVLAECEREARLRGAQIWRGGVFGDDIVCHEVVYGSVCGVLGRLGLKVNSSKSYVCKPFKESCGLDLFDGIDVTPIKIKSLRSVTPSDWTRLVAYANALFIAGYWRAADVLVSEIVSRWPKTAFGPFGAENCLWSHTAQDFHPARYVVDWQSYVPWHPVADVGEVISVDDEPNLDYWLAHGRRVSEVKSEF